MNKRNGVNRLGVKASHRKAIHRNMMISVFRHGRIQTTLPKAKAVRRSVERLITKSRVDSVHNRRQVARFIHDKDIVSKLFTEIAPVFANRPGGYTRIIKMGLRRHDTAEMAIIELLGYGLEEPKSHDKERQKIKVRAGDESVETESNSVEAVSG